MKALKAKKQILRSQVNNARSRNNERQLEKALNKYFKALEKQWNIYVSEVQDYMFSVSSSNCNFLNAINKILEHLNVISTNNIYYFSLNSFDARC